MVPLTFSRHRTVVQAILWLLCAVLAALAATITVQTEIAVATPPALHRSAGMTKGYCASDLNVPTVYFTNIFDANIKARTKISTAPLNFAFKNYLVEEYDFKTTSNYPTQCSLFETLGQAETSKRQLISQAQRANKQIVEVTWNPNPLEEVPMGDGFAIGPKGPPPTHTICALGHQNTMYFSAVFDTAGWQVNPAWNDAFNDFLRKTYSAEGEANCTTMNTVREAERLLRDRVAGVRANRRTAVETGWRYNASLVVKRPTPRPTAKVDDDPEPPAQRPAPPPPSADIRQFATNEVPAALAYCQNDRMISGSFDCYCIQRAVYNYRIEHASQGPPEPLASLFAKDKVDCSNCIGQFVTAWATSHAQSQSLTRPVAECVANRYVTNLRAKPYPSHVKQLFAGALAACK
jgi:hypothetical protein